MRARRVKARGSSFEMGVVQYGVGFLFYLVEYFVIFYSMRPSSARR